MTHLIRAITLLASVTLTGTGMASDAPSSPAAPTDAEADPAQTWSQAQLFPEPALQQQVKRTKELLDDKEAKVLQDIARLKSQGDLDRRSSVAIPGALDDARETMASLAAEILTGKKIPGGTAREIARKLGVAADTLAQQADKVETELSGTYEGGERSKGDSTSHLQLGRHLAQDLKATSDLLRSTAHGIVENLK